MEISELKVGDWVRVCDSNFEALIGMLGQIEEFDDDAFGMFMSVNIVLNRTKPEMSYLFQPSDLEIPTEEEVMLWKLSN